MSVYLGYNEVTKQYLRSLGRSGSGGSVSAGDGLSLSGFAMSGDINMGGNEVIGLDDPSGDSSTANKKYVDDEVAKISGSTGGGLDQATADGRYLQKTDASSTYETQTDASNTFLSKTDATNTYAPIDASYTKVQSDTKYARKGSGGGGGLSTSGFTMTGDINMGSNKILKLADPITPKSATNKEYVDNNFLSKHGGLILGNIAMSGQSITNLNPVPQSFNEAVTKKYVDDSISLAGGLSITGITMQGDINMSGHNVIGLDDPKNDDMAASKGYVDSNFLDLAGGTMVGTINMGGYDISSLTDVPTTDNSASSKKYVDDEINKVPSSVGGASTSGFSMTGDINMQQNEVLNLPDVPSRDHSAVSKKYMTDNFCNTSGDTMTGNLSMGGHEITNLSDVPTTDNSATSKKYVDATAGSGGLSDSGFTMKGDINMSGHEVIGVTSVPSFNNSLVNKRYVDDEVAAVTRGISQTQADARYVKKTKITLGEWMDTFDDVNFIDYNWSKHVKKSTLSSESNIEIRVASFVTDMSISQLLKHKLIIGIRYVDSSSTIAKHLITIPLSGKSFSKLSYGSSGTDYMYSFHIHDEEYIGNDSDAKNSFLWQVGAKFEATKSHVLLDTTAYITFALNEAGQFG